MATTPQVAQPDDTQQILGLTRMLLKAGIPLSKLLEIPALSQGLGGLSGALGLIQAIEQGNIPGAVGNTATLAGSLANLAGAPQVASGLGAVGGPLTFATGLAQGNPLQSVLGGVQTASLVSGALGGPTLGSLAAPALGALYNALPGATAAGAQALGVGAGAAGAAGSSAGLSMLGFPLMMILGGFAGKGADTASTERAFAESRNAIEGTRAKVGVLDALSNVKDLAMTPENLPGMLRLLKSTLSTLPDLGLIAPTTGDEVSSAQGQEIYNEIDHARKVAGDLWIEALDAAHRQGVDTTEALQSPWRVTGDRSVSPQFSDPWTGLSSDRAVNSNLTAHALGLEGAEGKDLENAMAGFNDGTMTWATMLERAANPTGGAGDDVLAKAFGPDRLPALKEQFGLFEDAPGVAAGSFNPAKLNALLDSEWGTTTLRDAIKDTTDPSVAGSDAWQTLGTEVYGGGINNAAGLPSMDTIADMQRRLAEAGFTPGNYGAARSDPGALGMLDTLAPPAPPPLAMPQTWTQDVGGL